MSNAISAVASLLWPLMVLVALVVFRNPLTRLIRQRDFTVKIAGQELTVSDLSQQQTTLITDLQKQVATLEKQISELGGNRPDAPGTPAPEPAKPATPPAEPAPVSVQPPAATGDRTGDPPLDLAAGPAPWDRLPDAAVPGSNGAAAPVGVRQAEPDEDHLPAPQPAHSPAMNFGRPKPSGVLWVADRPGANALEIARLQANNVHVDVATSTAQGLELLASHRYELIVSDMARVENGRAVPDAGLQLVKQVRTLDRDTPLVIYADPRGLNKYGASALDAGATTVTANTYELAREFAALGMV
ncbi:MAG TPA: hypothetical protein VG756_15445 [Pseudonocardiaceae bacterium]|nr:hypothetical protein [Pseudonocardiaceae bacterium]